ncbi:MAG: cob(I)yrinic acid a,c-diamide adenosyltransferase [Armatimonadetes bacterium]|nr:cob(I)yrinic acid a,c-diamide adenosyltransferase [Armatimonadota bacterium]
MKIYTKTGDLGESGLVGGQRISKQSALLEAIGDVDELNAWIGACRTASTISELNKDLQVVQNLLFEIGAELATPQESRFVNETLSDSHVQYLEGSIDRLSEALSPLRSFILPGGTELAARLHTARAVCRRAERSVVAIANAGGARPVVLQFLNRLSDWLFVAARTANHVDGVEDVKWVSEASES